MSSTTTARKRGIYVTKSDIHLYVPLVTEDEKQAYSGALQNVNFA